MQAIFFPDSPKLPESDRWFLEKDKLFCQNMYSYFRTEKGLTSFDANIYSTMVTMKKIHHGLKYSDQDEKNIRILLSTTHSVAS